MEKLLENLLNLNESIIDFPRKDLDPAIWDKVNGFYVIKPDVKKIILNTLDKYIKINLKETADEIHITGSIGTNTFTDDCDLDVHIVTNTNKIDNPEDVQGDVFKFFRSEENIVYIKGHNIEVYLQFNPKQEFLAESCYDLTNDVWIKGPKIVPESYDPYTDFSDILGDVKELAKEADEEMGELHRDVVDYNTILSAVGNLSGGAKRRLLTKLKDKLYEIEDDIKRLKKQKLSWIQLRRESSLPVSEEEALKDVKVAKRFHEANAIFKFLNRYKYVLVISRLEKILDDKKIDQKEIDIIKDVMGVNNE
ncbi:MAG: hypothetical protein ACTSUP_01195 [Candidatus Heimdallarchaeaceae archaeon]